MEKNIKLQSTGCKKLLTLIFNIYYNKEYNMTKKIGKVKALIKATDVILTNPKISYLDGIGQKVYGVIKGVESVNVLPISTSTQDGNPLGEKAIEYLKGKSAYFQNKTLEDAYYEVKVKSGFVYLPIDEPSLTIEE